MRQSQQVEGGMKGGTVGLLAGLAIVSSGIVLAATNPGDDAYNQYATERLSSYLDQEVCPDAPELFGIDLSDACAELLNENQDELRELIADNSRRYNYGVVSLYQTNLAAHRLLPADVRSFLPPQLLPAYEFKTVGILGQFVTYEARKQ